MSAFDDINKAFTRGNQNKPKRVAKETTPLTIKKATKSNKKDNNTNKENRNIMSKSYKTIRATIDVANLYQALQIATDTKSRSQIMSLVAKIAMPQILNTTDKQNRFKKTLKVIHMMQSIDQK